MKILSVAGARPNFMKIAPIAREIRRRGGIEHVLVHTGQHYDANMSDIFFKELEIPEPDISLGVGSGTHGEQTGKVMIALEKVLEEERPDLVVVVGDVNSTMAAAITAVKMGVKVAHVEAGLRSFDRSMPEEINRIVTDPVSDYLLVSEKSGLENLKNEGLSDGKAFFVGNVMIARLVIHLETAKERTPGAKLGLEAGG